MALLWFICGLGIGLAIWVGSIYRFNQRLSNILQSRYGESTRSDLAPFSRLVRLLSEHHHQQQTFSGHIQKWQNILQTAPVGYLEVDGDDHLFWLNSRAGRLLNVDPHRPIINANRHLLQVVRSYELDRLIKQVRQTQQGCQLDWTMPALPAPQSGRSQPLPLRGYGAPLPANHVGVFLEDRREATMLEGERDRWTSDVAHELKTPLTSIRLMAEALQDQTDPDLHRWIERLLQESIRLSDLVQDLLELSQVSGQQARSLHLQLVDLPVLVRSAWMNLEPLAQSKNLFLFYRGPDHLMVKADETRLYRVLINLIDNAIQYSPVKHPIQVHIEQRAAPSASSTVKGLPTNPTPVSMAIACPEIPQARVGWVDIDVIDHGPGFPPDALPHVFKRFFRAEASRVRSPTAQGQASGETGGGSGLGLAIVEQIVTAHGGSVAARNHPQTGGGWVQVKLRLDTREGDLPPA